MQIAELWIKKKNQTSEINQNPFLNKCMLYFSKNHSVVVGLVYMLWRSSHQQSPVKAGFSTAGGLASWISLACTERDVCPFKPVF